MAFDGITIAALAKELRDNLTGGRIYKIAQPEGDELILTIKTQEGQKRLLISAGASLPLIYLTEGNKPSPMTAPGFCMLLRKHLQNGRITDITQPGLERILHIHIEHLNEMGDLCHKRLIVEIMGKHSNIIFVNDGDMIIDSIKHISGMISSVREVLPGRDYFIPMTQDKQNPLAVDFPAFQKVITVKNMPVYKALYSHFTGISPLISQEICYRAGIDGDSSTAYFTEAEDGSDGLEKLFEVFSFMMNQIKEGDFRPVIAYDKGAPTEYAAFPLTMYSQNLREIDSISHLLEQYYAEKSVVTRIRQKSVDLRKIVQTALERNVKKYDLQIRQMQDTEKKDKYRIYGELLNTYGYEVSPGAKSMEALNYYTGEMITIPLDPLLSPSENAKKYFDKYGKLKRTCEAVTKLLEETGSEVEHLRSVQTALDIALQEEDLVQIKEELMQSGYIRKRNPGSKRPKITSKPFHYISSDGYHMYVGKNNLQNEELTFQTARGNDWWFHAKGAPGSHVIVQTNGDELPDTTFEEAARLAAYYSSNRGADKVEIDYVEKKHVKKPNGSRPGFVVYYTNYSMMIDSDISGIRQA